MMKPEVPKMTKPETPKVEESKIMEPKSMEPKIVTERYPIAPEITLPEWIGSPPLTMV